MNDRTNTLFSEETDMYKELEISENQIHAGKIRPAVSSLKELGNKYGLKVPAGLTAQKEDTEE